MNMNTEEKGEGQCSCLNIRSSSLLLSRFSVLTQRGLVQHQAVQTPGAGMDRLQESPALPLLLGLVAG